MQKLKQTGVLLIAICLLSACGSQAPAQGSVPQAALPVTGTGPLAAARAHIKHVVIVMQENRSFDNYFGTYPGAQGIPMQNGQPTVCLPDPALNQCDQPFHDAADVNVGGPHATTS